MSTQTLEVTTTLITPDGTTTITTTITTTETRTAPVEGEHNYFYFSQSKGHPIKIADMHPCHMFNALRKAMNEFGTKVLGEPAYAEMFRRLSETEPVE